MKFSTKVSILANPLQVDLNTRTCVPLFFPISDSCSIDMTKQQAPEIRQHEPTKKLVEGLPVKEVSKSYQNQASVSRRYTVEDLMGLSWVLNYR